MKAASIRRRWKQALATESSWKKARKKPALTAESKSKSMSGLAAEIKPALAAKSKPAVADESKAALEIQSRPASAAESIQHWPLIASHYFK